MPLSADMPAPAEHDHATRRAAERRGAPNQASSPWRAPCRQQPKEVPVGRRLLKRLRPQDSGGDSRFAFASLIRRFPDYKYLLFTSWRSRIRCITVNPMLRKLIDADPFSPLRGLIAQPPVE
jgi:hypothetical protein